MGGSYLDQANDLIGALERSGEAAEAAALRDAVEQGATGTEIAMALRAGCRDLLARRVDLDVFMKKRLADLVSLIDGLLR